MRRSEASPAARPRERRPTSTGALAGRLAARGRAVSSRSPGPASPGAPLAPRRASRGPPRRDRPPGAVLRGPGRGLAPLRRPRRLAAAFRGRRTAHSRRWSRAPRPSRWPRSPSTACTARAGSRRVLELLGNLWQVRCTRCGLRSANRDVPIGDLPSCPVCTALVRPDVLWRGRTGAPGDAAALPRGARRVRPAARRGYRRTQPGRGRPSSRSRAPAGRLSWRSPRRRRFGHPRPTSSSSASRTTCCRSWSPVRSAVTRGNAGRRRGCPCFFSTWPNPGRPSAWLQIASLIFAGYLVRRPP